MLSSRGEVKIHEILEAANINFQEEYIIKGLNSSNGVPLRFDFAIFDDEGHLDCLIEFQGRQHYEPTSKFGGRRGFYQQQFNDTKKRRYCALNHIKLVEIPYTEEHLINYDYIMEKAGLC